MDDTQGPAQIAGRSQGHSSRQERSMCRAEDSGDGKGKRTSLVLNMWSKWNKKMQNIAQGERTFFFFFLFGLYPRYIEVSRLRVEWELQQLRIWASSVSYTTAHSNAGAQTHWVRPGIQPAASCIRVGFVSAAPQRELPWFASKCTRKGTLENTKLEALLREAETAKKTERSDEN